MTVLSTPVRPTGYEPADPDQLAAFRRDGWALIPGALTEEHRGRLEDAVDQVYAEQQRAGAVRPDGSLHLLGFLTRHELFGRLLDHPATFAQIWNIAGWNIYSHHNHLDVNPPTPHEAPPAWGWHQDGYRQNSDPQAPDGDDPRPMFSVKIGYVLSDLSEPGRGATKVIPGSHLRNTLDRPADPFGPHPDPDGTVEIAARPGDAFLFDRRLWHSRSPNHSGVTRKMLFIGYTYRWIRPLDDMPVDTTGPWWAARSPVQRQLCGAGDHTANFWGVNWNGYVDDDIPLRHELKTRGLLDRSIPWLR